MIRSGGFTLIELITVMTMLTILAVGIAPLVRNAFDAYNSVTDGTAAQSRLQYASERISRELREINVTSAGYGISSTMPSSGAATSISFTQRVTGRSVTISGNLASYCATSSTQSCTLTLGYSDVGGGTVPVLLRNVSSFAIRYYKFDAATLGYVQTSDSSAVSFVEVSLGMLQNTITQRLRIRLRNQ
jgi:prepilin-type N-terminal cleavage/methylation domain-containing protein